ncbi:MAG: hypothetical protein B6D61_13565 [Bacteroidetes bacterium 4484_249]|nr:MAG: hypothetical protein B6D61_13565 [Bacteroidetes bacterium 4484_249]
MKTNLLKLLTIVLAFSFAGLSLAQTSMPENVKEVVEKYQKLKFYSDNNLEPLCSNYGNDFRYKTQFYEVDGIVISEILIMEWESGAWVNSVKMVNTYDGNDFLTEMMTYWWDQGAWNQTVKTEYTNNASGNPTLALSYNWNAGTQEWDLMFRDTYTYNGSGLCSEVLTEMWMVTEWINSGMEENSYDGNGNRTETITSVWEFMTNAWQNSAMFTYTYSNNLLTEMLSKNWQDNAWVNVHNTFWTYDGGTHYTEKLKKTWTNGQWENLSHGVPTYNNNWLVDVYIEEEWQNESWVNNYQELYTYDGNGNPTEVVTQDWVSGTWENDMKMIFSYTGVGIFEFSKTDNLGISLKNYPNPFTSETTFSFDISENSNVQLEVFDITGKKVITLFDSELTSGNYTVKWDGTNAAGDKLDSGLYLCRINANGKSTVKKLTISN